MSGGAGGGGAAGAARAAAASTSLQMAGCGARKKASRQMRDAARRSGPPPRGACTLPRGRPPARRLLTEHIDFAWCVNPQRARGPRVRARGGGGASGAWRRCRRCVLGAWRRGGRAARAAVARRLAGGSRRPTFFRCTAAILRSRTHVEVHNTRLMCSVHTLLSLPVRFSFILSLFFGKFSSRIRCYSLTPASK